MAILGVHERKNMKLNQTHSMPHTFVIVYDEANNCQRLLNTTNTLSTDLPRPLQLERRPLTHRLLGRYVENQQPYLFRQLHNRRRHLATDGNKSALVPGHISQLC